ncbi:S49 family peptidase [Ignatzschineria sp. LJL83]
MSESTHSGIPPYIDKQAISQAGNAHENSINSDLLAKTLANALNNATVEARRRRRWNIFFKLTFLMIFVLMVLGLLAGNSMKGSNIQIDDSGNIITRYTAVIDVKGEIAENSDASASRMISGIQRAYQDPYAVGIILRINSGGGSPVQSGYVYDEINRLRALYPEKKIYSVIEDIGASGAYYIAAATDYIYADKASLVGSIGVTAASFGFTGLMEKVGVERRLYTSGEYKAFLDPFSPQNAVETDFWKEVLSGVHDQFIAAVENGRGTRLNVQENPNLYSGLVWNGEQALEIGLIDGLGSAQTVAREELSAAYLVDFTEKEDPFAKMMKELGMGVVSGVKAAFPEIEWR